MKIPEEFLIHIGYHKTGSTFLQKSVFPMFGIKQLMLLEDDIAKSEDYDSELVINSLEKKYQISTWDKKHILISQESLVGHKEGHPIWDRLSIARNLKSTFPNAKILIVIRNQIDYILSLYTFMVYVKGVERRSLDGFLKRNMQFYPGLTNALRYDILVQEYQKLFGTNNVLVLPYELLARSEALFVEQIIDFMEWDYEINFIPGRVNVANRNSKIIFISRIMNWPLSVLIEWLKEFEIIPRERPSPPKLEIAAGILRRKFINPWLQQLFINQTNDLEIPSKWIDILMPGYFESNRRLAKITDLDLVGYGYPV